MKIYYLLFYFFIAIYNAQSSYSDTKNTVYIYNDEGVSYESFAQTSHTFQKVLDKQYTIKNITAKEVLDGSWTKDAALFIIPGGADLPYAKKLNGLGNMIIKNYIKEGGAFLGICAGSYYASSYVEFDKNGPLEILGERELSLFEGIAKGPILAQYDYRNQSGTRAARISTVFEEIPQLKIYYNGGGYFQNADKTMNTEVIASYDNKKPAIIKVTYGRGVTLLSGVHFEYDPSLLDQNDQYIKKIILPLQNSDKMRYKLISKMMEILKIKTN